MPVSQAERAGSGDPAYNQEITALSPVGRVPSRGVDGSTGIGVRPDAGQSCTTPGQGTRPTTKKSRRRLL